jgi:hypothetical protein
MRKVTVLIILFAAIRANAQKITTQSGLLINDKTIKSINYEKIDSVLAVNPGWRVPSIKELAELFASTFDKIHLRCAVTPGIYFSSDYEISGEGDTLRLVGQMYGRQFKALLPQYVIAEKKVNVYSLLLVQSSAR